MGDATCNSMHLHSVGYSDVVITTCPPQSVDTPHGKEWTRPLRVLAVQYPLQTSPITQPSARYIHTTQMDTQMEIQMEMGPRI